MISRHAADDKIKDLASPLQLDLKGFGLVVLHHERRQEHDVLDLDDIPVGRIAQRRARKLQIARAWDHSGAALEPMLIQQPTQARAELTGVACLVLRLRRSAVQERMLDWLAVVPLRSGYAGSLLGCGLAGHADLRPRPPVDGDDLGVSLRRLVLRVRVQESVRRRVVHLARWSQDGAGRRIQDDKIYVLAAQQAVQHQGPLDLRGQNGVGGFHGLELDNAVV